MEHTDRGFRMIVMMTMALNDRLIKNKINIQIKWYIQTNK